MQNDTSFNENDLLDFWADKLEGREYRKEITKEEEEEAKAAGIVVAFGASDDLVELRGAINDEFGAYDGLDKTIKDYRLTAKRCWPMEFWVLEVTKNHRIFTIWEDDDIYCIGVVFYA